MRKLVSTFTTQLKEALIIGAEANLNPNEKEIQNVLITGLGGSGIGGKIVSQLVADECNVPITINNSYNIPSFVNEKTLVIVSTFSGNTEETLFALKDAQNKGAEIAIITSGGEALEIAKANNYNHIILPPGDSPRAMFSYSFTQQFYLLNHYGLISGEFVADIEASINLLDSEIDSIKSQAIDVAKELEGKTTVIYAEAKFEGVAIRFRQQLNENAKVLCWHHVFPEMNHNELVGWAGGSDNLAVVNFRNEDDFERTQFRMDISKEVIKKYTSTYIEIYSKGESKIEKALYLILLGDWISVELAAILNVDDIEVNIISHLKGELAKLK